MAANDSTETPSLPTLPHELVEQIGEYLDNTDLLSLRSVFNREIVAATRRIFIKRHFWRRTHVYNFVGLQTLIDITADASLVKHIREIEVVPDPCTEYVAVSAEQPYPSIAGDYMNTLFNAETKWLEKQGAVMLALVLRNLNNVAHTVSFAVSRSEDSGRAYGSCVRALPARAAQVKISHRPRRLENQFCDEVAEALLEASAKEDAPIWQLDLGHHAPSCGLDDYGLRPRREGSSSSKLAWSALTCLKVHAGVGPRCWEWDDGDALGLRGFNELIAAAPTLESFTLAWTPARSCADQTEDFVVPMAGIGQILAQVVADFITAQAGSLLSLKLSNVGLELDSSWHRVLKVLAKEMSLKKIELSRIWRGEFSFNAQGQEENPCYILTSESGSQCHVYQGEEVVKQGLLQLVSTATEKEDGESEEEEDYENDEVDQDEESDGDSEVSED
ncbi:hypothetical protein LTS10_004634 [Elasticomyces elasticus]|nr:hypothetical protein LTS10_004634 [Elasticomyces elasticus]